MPGTAELLGGCQPSWPGSHHGHRFAGQSGRRQRLNPILLEGLINNGHLHLLDGHCGLVDAQHTRGFTGRRAKPAGPLRKVIGGMQALRRFLSFIPPGEVIPLGDEVSQRAALVAERHPTIHAASGLALEHCLFLPLINFFPVHDAHRYRAPGLGDAFAVLQETLRISHR